MSNQEIDVRDLNSVRQADILLGDDWVAPDATVEKELQAKRQRRSFIALNRSPLARKIITFNLLALVILVAGVLYLNPSRESLAFQRSIGLVNEAELIADVFEAGRVDAAAATRMVRGPKASSRSYVSHGRSASKLRLRRDSSWTETAHLAGADDPRRRPRRRCDPIR